MVSLAAAAQLAPAGAPDLSALTQPSEAIPWIPWVLVVVSIYGVVPLAKGFMRLYERREERQEKAAAEERAAWREEVEALRVELGEIRKRAQDDAERRGARSEVMRQVVDLLGRTEERLRAVDVALTSLAKVKSRPPRPGGAE